MLSDPIWALKLNKVISIKTTEINIRRQGALCERSVKLFVSLYTYVLNGWKKLTMQTKDTIETILHYFNATAMEGSFAIFLSV